MKRFETLKNRAESIMTKIYIKDNKIIGSFIEQFSNTMNDFQGVCKQAMFNNEITVHEYTIIEQIIEQKWEEHNNWILSY